MTAHLVTSHGADFFGEDRYPLRLLQQIAEYVAGTHPAAAGRPLVQLLGTAGSAPRQIPPDRAAEIAEQLRATACGRWTPPKLAAVIRLLADAAARAAADGEPWKWTPTTAE